jgi:hypothetical protein
MMPSIHQTCAFSFAAEKQGKAETREDDHKSPVRKWGTLTFDDGAPSTDLKGSLQGKEGLGNWLHA